MNYFEFKSIYLNYFIIYLLIEISSFEMILEISLYFVENIIVYLHFY